MARLILFNKPYDVLSQFTDTRGRCTLADYLNTPECASCYPAGRLDRDSEGLLLLTDSGTLQHQITHPRHKLSKTYWVQVEGTPSEAALKELRAGVRLKDGVTKPAKVRLIDAPLLWPRRPPVRQRQTVPTAWLEMKITEGRNRQVRRMTAAVQLPTLRLVRTSVGNWSLNGLESGSYRMEIVHPPAEQRPRTPKNATKPP